MGRIRRKKRPFSNMPKACMDYFPELLYVLYFTEILPIETVYTWNSLSHTIVQANRAPIKVRKNIDWVFSSKICVKYYSKDFPRAEFHFSKSYFYIKTYFNLKRKKNLKKPKKN
jgi:hypothetical protein